MFGKDGKPAPGEVLRKGPFGRIGFAHTDLTGDIWSTIMPSRRANAP